MDWIYLIQNKNKLRDVVDAVMNLRVPQNARNFLIRRGSVSFSRRTLLQGFSYIYYIVLVRPHLFPVLRTESDSQRSVQTTRCSDQFISQRLITGLHVSGDRSVWHIAY